MLRSAAIVLGVSLAAAAVVTAQHASGGDNRAGNDESSARRLVRTIIDHELQAESTDQRHWMYTDRLQEPGKLETKEVVETNGGKLELLKARNGHPIPVAERERELARLRKLVSDPSQRQSDMRAQREDAEKAQRMLKMLPDAFLYTIEKSEGDRVTLSFRPDPSFHPSNREGTAFHGMAGTLVLDTKQQRLVEIRGRLIHEVKFGLGILGHLDQGGQFLVKQAEVGRGYWEIAELDVQITGKALFFKSIALHQDELRTDYRPLPDNLPPQQGLAMLANTPKTLAQR